MDELRFVARKTSNIKGYKAEIDSSIISVCPILKQVMNLPNAS